MRLLGEVENFMTSVQRLYKYTSLDIEDELNKPYDIELEQ